MTQQARDLTWALDAGGVPPTPLLRDRDAKFSSAFDAVFSGQAVRVICTPARAPRASAFAERWVGTVRLDCSDWLLILGPRHLEHVLREYVRHYNVARPHRVLQLCPPLPRGQPVTAVGPVLRHDRLGGLLHEYSRCAARTEFPYPTGQTQTRTGGRPRRVRVTLAPHSYLKGVPAAAPDAPRARTHGGVDPRPPVRPSCTHGGRSLGCSP